MSDRKELPNDLYAERMLISTCLQIRDEFDDVAGWLKPIEFWHAHAAFAWEGMLAVAAAGREINIATVNEWLVGQGKDADCPLTLLVDLAGIFSTHSASSFAALIRKAFLRRKLIEMCCELTAEANSPDPDVDPIESAERKLFALSEHGRASSEPRALADIVREAVEEIGQRKAGKRTGSLPTGFGKLDHIIGGLEDGAFVIIAARPSVGKTAFALNMLMRMCRSGPILFESLEQAEQELAERLLSREAAVDGYRLKVGRTSNAEDGDLAHASQRLCGANVFIDSSPSQTVTGIASTIRRFRRRFGIRAVLIDYLQLIEPEDRRSPRHEQVQALTRRIKITARETGIPIVVLAQLNREVENRPDGRPKLSDLRESGAIEQDADVVLLLHEDRKSDNPLAPATLEVIVAKNRNGARGTVLMAFQKQHMRIDEMADPPRGGAEWMK